jgi:cell division control protein 24
VTVVTWLLDKLEEDGLLMPVDYSTSTDMLDNPIGSRQKVIKELIMTEREYVAALEKLMVRNPKTLLTQEFRGELQAKNLLNSDTIHLLFANLPQLVEFQRRFLIGVEVLVTLPEEKQQFGSLFTRMEEGFEVYEPFCANVLYANELAQEESKNGTLSKLSDLDDPSHQFGSLLIKPVQRICKYPLLLKQLLRYTDKTQNPHLYSELEAGIASIERVTFRVNETRREQENIAIQKELITRIVNWKEIDPNNLGSLLLSEAFPVLMGDKERVFQCFLFHKMLLCCRDDNMSREAKKASKTMSMSKRGKGARGRDSSVPPKTPLSVKGRLYIRDIRDIYIPQDRSTGTPPSKTPLTPGTYFITIRYRPEDNAEVPIILRPRSEETMMKWYTTIMDLHKKLVDAEGDYQNRNYLLQDPPSRGGPNVDRSLSTSNMRSAYASQYNGTEIGSPITPPGSGSDDGEGGSQAMSRSVSASNSDSQALRKPPPGRFPSHNHGLPPHVRSGSINDYQGSYFSPMAGTPPVPSRSISPESERQYPFPGQEEGRRSRDGYYNGMPTPPLTARSTVDKQSRPALHPLNMSRSRSASTPNIHQIQTNFSRSRDLPPPLPSRRDRDSDSPVTPHSPGSPVISSRPTTGTSTFTTTFSSIPETPSSISSGSSSATRRAYPSSSTSSVDKSSAVKVKITYGADIFVVVVPSDVSYSILSQKVRKKLQVCSNLSKDGLLRIKYQDEDGDYVNISSDEDVALAIETRTHPGNVASQGIAGAGVINLLVSSANI